MLSNCIKACLFLGAGVTATAHAQDNNLPSGIDECLQKATYTERQSCLQMNIDLLRLQQELTTLATFGDTDKSSTSIDYDVPQPVAVLAGPKMRTHVEFSYQGGMVSGGQGDMLAAGWKIKRIGNASVTLTRKGRDIVLGYSSGSGDSNSMIPVMDSPLVAAPRQKQSAQHPTNQPMQTAETVRK